MGATHRDRVADVVNAALLVAARGLPPSTVPKVGMSWKLLKMCVCVCALCEKVCVCACWLVTRLVTIRSPTLTMPDTIPCC
jgi:hypothetical protein